MSDDRIYIGKAAQSLTAAAQLQGYSKVILQIREEDASQPELITQYEAGTDTGRTLTLFCPWGTEKMAGDILSKIQGYGYQPFTAEGALADPAAELGDAVTVKNVYGGVYSLRRRFSPAMVIDLGAPFEEELDHEFPYVPQTERVVTRQILGLSTELRIQDGRIQATVARQDAVNRELTSTLTQQAGLIEAKVSKKSPEGNTAFGWALDDDSWEIKSGSTVILKATKAGLEVRGKVTATSGQIGDFAISGGCLSLNKQVWGGSLTMGIYMGRQGIQIGSAEGGITMTSSGEFTATNGTFRGNVNAGKIRYGDSYGTLHGNGIQKSSLVGNRLVGGTITTAYTSGGINLSLGYADYSYDVVTGLQVASAISAQRLYGNKVTAAEMEFNGHGVRWQTLSYKNSAGETATVTVLARK